MSYFNCHTHTHYSNIRLLDCINRPEDVIQKARELGLSGIAFTDHECLSGAVKINKLAADLQKIDPNFTIALGNEIYLTDDRRTGQKYYHFILIAKDAIGHKALRELSSTAWYNSYVDRGMERVPTLKCELKNIMSRYKGHVIATSACMGGEASSLALLYALAKNVNDMNNANVYRERLNDFLVFCQELFGDDFYIECAPSTNSDQILVNKTLLLFATHFNIPMVAATDAHYLTKEDRWVHKAYLNSKGGEREVDAFYEFTYLMDEAEIRDLLDKSFPSEVIDNIILNTNKLKDKINFYSLFKSQDIPHVDIPQINVKIDETDYDIQHIKSDYPNLFSLLTSKNNYDRYWVTSCFNKLMELKHTRLRGLLDNEAKYLEELEEEVRVKKIIGEKLDTNMFRYPIVLQHYIDMIWECGSMVGAGRGSSCAALNHYLLGITQLDPLEWELPFFRYLNDERVELGDIDVDLCPSKRPLVLQKIREDRAHMFAEALPQWVKDNLGCSLIATFGTEGAKSAIQTACRGYRSEDFPDGIDVDEAQYMSSLIPQERGFLWDIKDVVSGNEEKGRRPVTAFINEVNKYPGLLKIIQSIENLINKRSSHASGVLLLEDDPFDNNAFMKTPNGEIITAFDLHDAEFMGNTKYDFLVTDVQDKLVQAIALLQEDGQIEKNLTLRQVYDKYFHPNVLPLQDPRIWDALGDVSVINCFQFDSAVGSQVAKKLRPRTVCEMSDANGLMRLMGEEGQERPMDKYYRFKQNINLWYHEMREAGLSDAEQKTLEPHFLSSYGVPPSQEQLMRMLMDPNICGFTLAEANAARKVVGKKLMNKIPELRQKVLAQAKSEALGKYVWAHGVGPQMGYSFSEIHALAYSFIGVQTLYIATNWNPIYWNTACLIVNSGAINPENSGQTDYAKIAKAIGDITNAGIKISLVDINKSSFGFKPDIKNNQILYGLKAMLNVGDDVIDMTIAKRPYSSPKDYLLKVNPKKPAMISLIKGGAFDSFMDRKTCMGWYIWETCDKKKRITLQNMNGLIKYDIFPTEDENLTTARKFYEFNRYLKAMCKTIEYPQYYLLNVRAINFLDSVNMSDMIELQDGNYLLSCNKQEKTYQNMMDIIRTWISQNHDEILQSLNEKIFYEDWKKYAEGTLSAWEMKALCFYYHEHELAHINNNKYGFVDFYKLPEAPVVEEVQKYRDKEIKRFKLHKICGTCIACDKVKSTVSLLTTSGVVSVKFRKEYFSLFNKQISQRGEDGVKHVIQKSWFTRGNMIVVQGVRSGDDFIVKKYATTPGHQLYLITKVNNDGTLELTHERPTGEAEEVDE